MKDIDAVAALSALAQVTRLRVFRMIIDAGLEGLPAGAISDAEGVPHNTMSSHLAILLRAGLISSRRDGRSIIYTANIKGTRAMLGYLVADCCGGQPEICQPLARIAGTAGPSGRTKSAAKKRRATARVGA